VGQTAGIVAFLMFLFMWLYPLRKRFSPLARLGTMGRWLDVHIAVGLLLPLIGAVHAGWRFNGLIGLGYAAMLTVCVSGIIGRYLYTRIPRGRSGLELSLVQVQARRERLVERIGLTTGLDRATIVGQLSSIGGTRRTRGIARTLVGLLADDLLRGRDVRRLVRSWQGAWIRPVDAVALREVLRLVRREVALTQHLHMLEATQRVFRFWHVAHRPFAITTFLAVTIHVVVVVALGVTWIR
jgi:hypothetical protein